MSVKQTLSVTEVSVDNSTNTSKVRILWQSTQSGDSHNDYTRTAKYYVSINDGAETEYAVSYTLPQASTKTIVDTTITVTHSNDGTGSVKVRTWMDTSISAGVVEKSQTLYLTKIPRKSSLTVVNTLKLGDPVICGWIPYSSNFRYRITITAGEWSYNSDLIHPNRNGAPQYQWVTPITLPYTIANRFPNDVKGYISVTLTTYSDSAGAVQLGFDTKTTYVHLPEGKALPDVKMSLSPVISNEHIPIVFLQGRTKVQADFTGSSGQYGATITSYSMKIGAKTYSAPYLSDTLATSGEVTVIGTATDSRGRTNSVTQTIVVQAYSKPSIITYTGHSNIICKRCLSDGTVDNGGTYLLLMMGREYSKVTSDGTQLNQCTLSYRYKTDSQDASQYSAPKIILAGTADTDYVNMVIPNVVSSNTTAYNIQLIAEDTCGETDIVTITIPTMFVTVHIPEGGHGLTLGGYHDASKYDVFDCQFDAEFHGTVSGSVYGLLGSSGEIPREGDLNDYKTPGIYAIPSSTRAETLTNMPYVYNPADGKTYRLSGLLRVYASIGQTYVSEGSMKYITQEFRPLAPQISDYRRLISSNEDGEWSYGEWMSTRGD